MLDPEQQTEEQTQEQPETKPEETKSADEKSAEEKTPDAEGDEPKGSEDTPQDTDDLDKGDEDEQSADYWRGKYEAATEQAAKPDASEPSEDIDTQIADLRSERGAIVIDQYDDADEKVEKLQKREALRDKIDDLKEKRQAQREREAAELRAKDAYDGIASKAMKDAKLPPSSRNVFNKRLRAKLTRDGYANDDEVPVGVLKAYAEVIATRMQAKSGKDAKSKKETRPATGGKPAGKTGHTALDAIPAGTIDEVSAKMREIM